MVAKVRNVKWIDGRAYGRKMVRGQELTKPLETTDARIAAQRVKQWLKELSEEKWRPKAKPSHTVEAALDRLRELHFKNLSAETLTRYESALIQLSELTQDKLLNDISQDDILNYLKMRRKAGISDTTFRLEMKVLASIYEVAIAAEWCEVNAAQVFMKRNKKFIGQPVARKRILSHAEAARLLEAIHVMDGRTEHTRVLLAAYVILCLETGLRADEMLYARWRDVDVDAREITVVGKGGKVRQVPLRPDALAILSRLRQSWHTPYKGEDKIFWSERRPGETMTRLNSAFAQAVKEAGLVDLTIHDLRRTCGARLLREGLRMEEVSAWLGHENVTITQKHYAWLDTATLHKAVGNPVRVEVRPELNLGFLPQESVRISDSTNGIDGQAIGI